MNTPPPKKDEIRKRAIELFWAKHPEMVGLAPPEDLELKEENLWRQAQIELMRGWTADIDADIEIAVRDPSVATTQYLEYLKSELDALEGMIEELRVPVAPPPFKETLWIAFSDILRTAGISPEIHREAFDEEYEAVKGRSESEQRTAIITLAKDIVKVKPPPPKPPVYPSPDEVIALFIAGRLTYPQYQEMFLEAVRRRKPVE